MRALRLCEIWCVRVKRRSRISCELVIGWASFYCGRVSVRRPELEHGQHLHLIWVSQIRFTQAAQESTRLDYLHEVEHMRERVLRLEQAIVEAVKLASPALQEVITDLQALRGIAHISAVAVPGWLGQVSRFRRARGLMGCC